jgi:hypothetical protein
MKLTRIEKPHHDNDHDHGHKSNKYCQFLKRSCKNETGKHMSSRLLGIIESKDVPNDGPDSNFDNHPAMPTKCDCCDYVFTPTDDKGVFYVRLYATSHGQLMTANGLKK